MCTHQRAQASLVSPQRVSSQATSRYSTQNSGQKKADTVSSARGAAGPYRRQSVLLLHEVRTNVRAVSARTRQEKRVYGNIIICLVFSPVPAHAHTHTHSFVLNHTHNHTHTHRYYLDTTEGAKRKAADNRERLLAKQREQEERKVQKCVRVDLVLAFLAVAQRILFA